MFPKFRLSGLLMWLSFFDIFIIYFISFLWMMCLYSLFRFIFCCIFINFYDSVNLRNVLNNCFFLNHPKFNFLRVSMRSCTSTRWLIPCMYVMTQGEGSLESELTQVSLSGNRNPSLQPCKVHVINRKPETGIPIWMQLSLA